MKLSGCFSNSLLDIGKADVYILLLLGHTHSFSLVSGGLGVLTSHTETPVVTEPTVGPDLLESLKILTQLVVEDVGHDLGGLAVLDVTLPVQEPVGDLVLTGILSKKMINFTVHNKTQQDLTWTMVINLSTSSSLSSPALLFRGMSAFFRQMLA